MDGWRRLEWLERQPVGRRSERGTRIITPSSLRHSDMWVSANLARVEGVKISERSLEKHVPDITGSPGVNFTHPQ